ncbi:MAG: hypothetical protein STSR0008_21960 [Ignavibacterium sp.]
MELDILNEQRKLDSIHSWLSDTTEEIDDWDYDGIELLIFLKGVVIERYSNTEIKDFIKDF